MSPAAILILKEFANVFVEELPVSLPFMRDIQHVIDFVPGSSFSKLPHYKMNLAEHAELKRQVDKLLKKGFITESLGPCAVSSLLTP